MAKQSDLFLTKDYRLTISTRQTFINADGTTIKDICTGGADDSNIIMLIIASDDTAAKTLLLYLNDGTNNNPIGHLIIPIGAGTNGTTNFVNGLTSTIPILLDPVGNYYIPLPAGCKLRAGMLAAVTAAKTITVTAVLGDF